MSKFRIVVIAVLVILAAAVVASAAVSTDPAGGISLRITPVGQTDITLEYGQSYEEPGAEGLLCIGTEAPQSIQVETQGTVDTQKVGTYTVRYVTRHGENLGTAYRRVRVVDTQAPVITLVSDPDRFTYPNEIYTEEGFTAQDNYDGDLTAAVCRTATADAIIYTVSDSSGNTATVTRPIVYNDPVAPELTLKGEDSIILSIGSGYREPGYTATDNCDGDITDRVSVSGSVNSYRPGSYTITYTVKDSFENTATATRSVFVKDPEVDMVNDPTGTGNVIYLTFDDGPSPETPRLLDILGKYNVKATFFVVNTKQISTVQRIAQEGHTVALHTATHRFHDIYASDEAFFEDLYKIQQVVQSYTGQTPMLMRFAGGSSNTISSFNKGIMTRLTAAVEEKGFTYFDWNVDSRDTGGAKTADDVFLNVVGNCIGKNASVVLMHDIKSYTVDAIESIILWGLENGYRFLPLTAESPTCHHTVQN